MLLKEVYTKAKIVKTGKHYTTVNEFTDQIPALRPKVLKEAANAVLKVGDFNVDKIVTEEDKGAPLATLISILTDLPLAMARWYPYSLESYNDIKVNIDCEYFHGTLYLNGIQPGDRVTIVDDTISTGGTLIALIHAIRTAGGIIVDVICVTEKFGNEGVSRVLEETGILVKSIICIDVNESRVVVL